MNRLHSVRYLGPQLLLAVFGCASAALLFAEGPPSWWSARGVTIPGKPQDDYAVANAGQLKQIAKGALEEMNDVIFEGAGTEVSNMVAAWATTVASDDFAAVTVGQVKATALPFYERMALLGRPRLVPWQGQEGGLLENDDYAVANIGQVKAAFAIVFFQDNDGNGIDDSHDAVLATLRDSDGDGVSDADELAQNTDPFNPASNAPRITGLTVWTRTK